MGDVKVVENSRRRASHAISPVLSLGRIDPYYRSHILVEYSKDLGACMILDDPDRDDEYMLDDMVIYSHGKVFLTIDSSLKEKLLHAAHEDFFPMHFDAYLALTEEFIWEGIQQDIHQHMERCRAWMMMERMSQPPSYSWRVREHFLLSHFNSSLLLHDGECTIPPYFLYFLSFYEQHIVPRRIIPSCILYHEVLGAIFNIDIGYFIGGLWGKPCNSWCAPLAPNYTFMFMTCKMIVV